MPTYQYACTACGEQHEAVQAFTDPPLTDCPACDGRLRKVFSAVGVVFKGSGFYKTDSRKGSGSQDGSKDGAAAKTDGAAAKADGAAAAKTEGASAARTDSSKSKSGSGSSSTSTSTPAAKTA